MSTKIPEPKLVSTEVSPTFPSERSPCECYLLSMLQNGLGVDRLVNLCTWIYLELVSMVLCKDFWEDQAHRPKFITSTELQSTLA